MGITPKLIRLVTREKDHRIIEACTIIRGFVDKIHSHRKSLQDTTAEHNEIRIRSRKEQLRKAIVKIIHFLTQKKLV